MTAQNTALLRRARIILSEALELHCLSVRIGQLEPIADSGVLASEMRAARQIIERADRLCAEIDKQQGASK